MWQPIAKQHEGTEMGELQEFQNERPAFSGRRPVVENGVVVGVENFSVKMLPADIAGMIFAKFALRYTKKWADEIASAGITEAFKNEWRRELGGVELSAIKWALDNLPPSYPPTCGEFRALVRRAPSKTEFYAPQKRGNLTDSERNILKMLRRKIEERAEENEAKRRARLAEMGISSAVNDGAFSAIKFEVLPPGMREDVKSGLVKYNSAVNKNA